MIGGKENDKLFARQQKRESAIPYSESDLIRRAIKQAKPLHGAKPRWALVKSTFCTGQGVSEAICRKYGFDPDRQVAPLAELSEEAYEENLLQHGISR